MKRVKKISQGFFSVVFSAVLVVGLMPGLAYAAPADLTPQSDELAGEGTEESPYLISSAEDFELFISDYVELFGFVEDSYKLTADVTLDSLDRPIGDIADDDYIFAGTFDGSGHTVTVNATYSDKESGLFVALNGATVRNLTIKGSVASTYTGADAATGALAATCKGNVTIDNVINEASVTSSAAAASAASTGGLIGHFEEGSGSSLTITNSANMGAVGFSAGVGGGKHSAGGLVGSTEATTTSISSSYNVGAITNANYTGGIVGAGSPYRQINVTSCYNAGTIPALTSSVYSGGILGAASTDSAANRGNANIANCCVLQGTQITSKSDYVTLTNARIVSADALKANPSVIGNGFIADSAGGYPVLIAQAAAIDVATQVDVHYRSSDESMGTLSCGGERVTIGSGTPKGSTAVPASGYHFVKWTDASGATVSANATFVPTATANAQGTVTYTAVFEEDAIAMRSATFKVNQENAVITVMSADSTATQVTVTPSGSAADANGYWTWTAELDPTLSYNVTVNCEGAKEAKTDTIAVGTDAIEKIYELVVSSNVQEVVIGEESSTGSSYYQPYRYYDENALTEQIYMADEIGVGGSIESLSFYTADADTAANNVKTKRNLKIYLGHIPATTTTLSSFVDPKDLTLVYENSAHLANTETGWERIDFDTPFDYNGTDNLAVVVLANGTQYTLQQKHKTTSTNGNTVFSKGKGTAVPYTSLDVAKSDTATPKYEANRPNIKLDISVCDHANKTFKQTVASTCTEEGYTIYHCDDCGKDVKLDKVAALGHDEQVTITTPATCETDGSKTTTCKRTGCDYSLTEVIPATGHNWDWEHATAPDENGNTTATCLNDPTHKKTRNIYVSEWDGNAEAWSEGDGSEANPYLIESAANLAYLAEQVKGGNAYSGTYFRLEMDLDLKNIPWTPVGVYVPSSSYSGVDRAFSGIFDGGNHSISNLAISSSESGNGVSLGLFGIVDGASIRNVNVTSGEVKYDAYSSASLGGIIGYAKGTVSIENCHNAASISGGSYQGGILGKLKESATLSMSTCGNTGDIVTTKSSAEAGGLIGELSRSYTSGTTVIVQNSRNTGEVKATGTSSYAGGLIGYANYTALTCKAAYSNADVTSVNAGGLLGYMGSSTGMKSLDFTSCYAAGTVEGSTSEGGIIGIVNGTMLAQDKAKFVNTAYPVTSGGAIGKNIDAGYFTNCLECDSNLCNAPSTATLLNTDLDQQDVDGTMTPVFSVGVTAPVLYWELDTLPDPAVQRAATFTVSPAGSTLALTDTTANQAVVVTKDATASSADADVFKATLDPTHDYNLAITKQYYEGQTVTIYASPYQNGYEGSYVLESVFNKEVVIGNPEASSQTYASYYAPYRPSNKNVVTEQIYTADEINALAPTGSIKDLSFCVDMTGALEADLKIYLGHTTATGTGTSSAVAYVAPTDLQLVYDGHLTLGQATGWETIEFDQPFAYDHESSLVVIAVRSSESTSSLRYKVESTGTTRQVWGKYINSPNYTDLQTALDDSAGTAITVGYAAYRPVIRLGVNSCTHSEVTASDTKTVAPTCTERGYTATTCPMCNTVISKTYNAEPLGHDFHEQITLVPTCESEGAKHITCSRCDYAVDEDIAALGHNWDWEHATALDDKGNVEASCLNGCGKTKTKNLYVDEWDGTAVAWTTGDGSEANPYQIESAENLAYLAQQVEAGEKYADKHFELATNLDLRNLPWAPIGSGGSSSTATVFSGIFDGAGHTIANLNISLSSGSSRGYGLFGGISGATIQDLHIISGNVSVAVESSYGSGYVAGLVGYTATDSDNAIIRCSNAADVAGYTVGGIVGYNNGDVTIEHCKNTGNITSPLSQSGYAGGLVGNQFKAITMTSCYSTGDVSGSNAGGLAGRAGYSATYPLTASNCYAFNMPTGTNAGGLFGRINTSAAGALSASDCYWAGASNNAYGATTNPAEGSFSDCAGLDDFMSEDALAKLNAGLDKVTYNGEEMDVFSAFEDGDVDHPILFWEPRVPIEITADADSMAFVIDEANPDTKDPQSIAIDYNGALELSVSSADDTIVTAALTTDDEGIVTLTVTPVGAGTTVVTITDGKRTLKIQAVVATVAVKGGSLRMDSAAAGDYSSTSLRMGFAIEMPQGMDVSNVSWQWKYGLNGTVDDNLVCPGANYQMDGDMLVTNIVFTGVNAANYERELAAQLEYTMTFTDADGQVRTVSSIQPVQTRSVLDVATAIAQSDSATSAEKQYATGILRQSAAARS